MNTEVVLFLVEGPIVIAEQRALERAREVATETVARIVEAALAARGRTRDTRARSAQCLASVLPHLVEPSEFDLYAAAWAPGGEDLCTLVDEGVPLEVLAASEVTRFVDFWNGPARPGDWKSRSTRNPDTVLRVVARSTATAPPFDAAPFETIARARDLSILEPLGVFAMRNDE